jgi:hypothetical protein
MEYQNVKKEVICDKRLKNEIKLLKAGTLVLDFAWFYCRNLPIPGCSAFSNSGF